VKRLTDTGLAMFPATLHSQMVYPEIAYKDDSAGNAIAGLLGPTRVELRNHRSYSVARVAELWRRVLARPETALLQTFTVTYQGRSIF
jgi:hypothetical protein